MTQNPAAPKSPPAPAPRRRGGIIAMLACALLLVVFATLAWIAVDSKSPTYDEPLHAVGAWLHLHKGDFRVNPEDPPLWHYWAAFPNGKDALNPLMNSEVFGLVAGDIFYEWPYVVDVLYRTEGNDGDAIVARSRRMMLIIGVVLGGVIGWWSQRLGGTVAALAATAAFALDPNFLAHAPLVKNDVSFTLVMLLLAIAVWRAGKRLTVWNGLAICLLCGAGLNVKFSALLLGPIVALLLLVRAIMPEPWTVLRRQVRTRGQKVLVAAGLCALAAIVSYVSIWACYGFRFRPTPEPGLLLNTKHIIEYLAINELKERHPGRALTAEDFRQWRPGPFSRAVLAMERNRLLPQAWLNGLLYTQQSAVLRKTFLLGEFSMTGWWYYFPLTMLFKSPLALIVAAAGAVAVGIVAWRRERAALLREHGWTIAVFAIPVGIYLFASMTSNLNLGIRHVLPIYPFLFVAIGTTAAYAWRIKPKPVKLAGTLLFAGLGFETLIAFPNFLAFFNTAAGGSRGGIELLGDSNLDWGQDLKLLSQWQQNNPGVPLSLCYFGTADPWHYQIEYTNLRGGYQFGAVPQQPRAPGVVAISATHLQGIYLDAPVRRLYNTIWKNLEPIEVLGGTIYLYDALDVLSILATLPPDPARPASLTKPGAAAPTAPRPTSPTPPG